MTGTLIAFIVCLSVFAFGMLMMILKLCLTLIHEAINEPWGFGDFIDGLELVSMFIMGIGGVSVIISLIIYIFSEVVK